MARPRIHADGASKQRAYRERVKARRRQLQGVTDAELALAVRDLHISLEYAAAVTPTGLASRLVGKDALETFRNVRAMLPRLFHRMTNTPSTNTAHSKSPPIPVAHARPHNRLV